MATTGVEEKLQVKDEQVERGSDTSTSDIDHDEIFTREEQRKIVHRIDRRLVVILGIIYCISLIDRTNLPAASLAGLNVELGIGDSVRYNIIALVFFLSYTVFQPLGTILIRKIGPRVFLATITLLWSAVMIGFGFVRNWQTLAGLRVLLGLFEAGYFPGSVYLLSTWYPRYEMQRRYTLFYLIGSVASAFSGIMAYGFMQMSGLQGLSGWRWIFIMEGVLSCAIAIAAFFLLVGFPENSSNYWGFLNKEECDFVIRRVNKDRGDVQLEPFTMKRFFTPALDFKVWCFALMFFCTTMVTYAIAYFLPIILRRGMGFSIAASQCLVAPPFVFAGIVMVIQAYFSDKYRLRSPTLIFNAVMAIVGLSIMGFTMTNGARYFGVFLVTAGANANIPTVLSYQANNIRGQWKRAFCSASLVGFGGIGGIGGSLVFRGTDAPRYLPGVWACITANLVILCTTIGLTFYFRSRNSRARKGLGLIEGYEGFLYTL